MYKASQSSSIMKTIVQCADLFLEHLGQRLHKLCNCLCNTIEPKSCSAAAAEGRGVHIGSVRCTNQGRQFITRYAVVLKTN